MTHIKVYICYLSFATKGKVESSKYNKFYLEKAIDKLV